MMAELIGDNPKVIPFIFEHDKNYYDLFLNFLRFFIVQEHIHNSLNLSMS